MQFYPIVEKAHERKIVYLSCFLLLYITHSASRYEFTTLVKWLINYYNTENTYYEYEIY